MIQPLTAFGATNILIDESFGAGASSADVPNWNETGIDNLEPATTTLAQAAENSGEETASPDGGRFAKIYGEEWICKEISAIGFTNLKLSYFWRGDSNSNSASDRGVLEYAKGSGGCDLKNWNQLKVHDMREDATWQTQAAFSLPDNLNKTVFRLRFRASMPGNDNNNDSNEHFRVDKIVLTGEAAAPQPNTAPIANNQEITVAEDVPAPLTLTATDPESDPLTYTIKSGPTNGTLSGEAPNMIYTPHANFAGQDTFTFQANDGETVSNTATISISVDPANDAPSAHDDAYSTPENSSLNISALGVLNNDSDIDNNSLTAVLITDTANGTTTLNSDGSFTYTPTEDYTGIDSFTYKANDGTTDSQQATVRISVSANNAPQTTNDEYSTNEDSALEIDAPGVLGNDSDEDENYLTAKLAQGTTHGALTLNDDGSFSYIPHADFNGTDSFTYAANDGTIDSSITMVNITVTPVNDAPVAYSTTSTVQASSVTVINLEASDIEGDSLVFSVVTEPTFGKLTAEEGIVIYTASSTPSSDSFTFKATDGSADSNTATVSITVAEPSAGTPENTQAACSDGNDNDNDGLTDLDDPDCREF
ncbi:MAG TPA: Ig-like domain-containing protein, partial [Candidatus Paceibacterota bacterium]|nr:Ig-like domain-containing protein [Candidatus Paceibacterota bacterium]